MVIFHSYVKLPEGKFSVFPSWSYLVVHPTQSDYEPSCKWTNPSHPTYRGIEHTYSVGWATKYQQFDFSFLPSEGQSQHICDVSVDSWVNSHIGWWCYHLLLQCNKLAELASYPSQLVSPCISPTYIYIYISIMSTPDKAYIRAM